MSDHLDKAKRALEAAAEMDIDLTADTLPRAYARLLDLAQVQAQVAQAEALTAVVDHLAWERKYSA